MLPFCNACNMNKEFLSTTELAKLMGISRVSVYRKIKRGDIKAIKAGRNFIIKKSDLGGVLDRELTRAEKDRINKIVDRVIEEYGEALEMLSKT